jgi:hypothetical protein
MNEKCLCGLNICSRFRKNFCDNNSKLLCRNEKIIFMDVLKYLQQVAKIICRKSYLPFHIVRERNVLKCSALLQWIRVLLLRHTTPFQMSDD